MSEFLAQLKSCGVRVQTGVSLASFTSFHIGGEAAFFVTVESKKQLMCALDVARRFHVDVCVLGGGSNVLIADEGFDGMVINVYITDISFVGNRVSAGAGVTTAQLAGQCVAHGLEGMEWAVGIPGRLGGAIVGNAGAMGGEMKDVVDSVRSVDVDSGEIRVRTNSECAFGYRDSLYKRLHEVIISCELILGIADDPIHVQGVLRENLQYRNATQPKRYGSSGCMFKNYVPAEDEIERLTALGIPQSMLDARRVSAGYLIDRAGCKGMRVGDAMVSDEHGNFVVNCGQASAADVRQLVDRVKARVREVFGIDLQNEVRFIGF